MDIEKSSNTILANLGSGRRMTTQEVIEYAIAAADE